MDDKNSSPMIKAASEHTDVQTSPHHEMPNLAYSGKHCITRKTRKNRY